MFDLFGDPVGGVAGVFELEAVGLAIMSAGVLEGFGEVSPVMIRINVPLDLMDFFEQEPVVVFGGDGEGLTVEPCGGPGEGAQKLPVRLYCIALARGKSFRGCRKLADLFRYLNTYRIEASAACSS